MKSIFSNFVFLQEIVIVPLDRYSIVLLGMEYLSKFSEYGLGLILTRAFLSNCKTSFTVL